MRNKFHFITNNFADRTEDLKFCNNFFSNNSPLLFINYQNKTGMSFFLQKLYEDELRKKDKKYDVYLVKKSANLTFIELLINNIYNKNEGWKFELAQKNLFLYFLKNLLTIGLPFLYLISTESNIGFSLADSLTSVADLYSSELDIQQNKIKKYFKNKKSSSIILIDLAENLSENDLDFIRELIGLNVKIILAYREGSKLSQSELFFKLFPNMEITCQSHEFKRPQEEMFKILCDKYNIDYSIVKNSLQSATNIIEIMQIINNPNIATTIEEKEILSFIYYGQGLLNKYFLETCYQQSNRKIVSKLAFGEVITKLSEKKLISYNGEYYLSNYHPNDYLSDAILYTAIICETFYNNLMLINTEQLKYIIDNEHEINRKIEAILLFAKIVYKQGNNIPEYMATALIDFLQNAISTYKNKELVEIVLSIFYIKNFNYESAYRILANSCSQNRIINKLYAYILNRVQNYELAKQKFVKLINTSTDVDERAVLVSVLAITFIHNNEVNLALDIFNNRSKICNFNQICQSSKSLLFLRNIAYYLNQNEYSKCLNMLNIFNKQKNSFYYNFTIKNNILARNLVFGNEILEDEVQNLFSNSNNIPIYERRIFYNNLGIYYIFIDINKAFNLFEKSIFLAKDHNNLPYIYANINYALALAYVNRLDEAELLFHKIESKALNSKLDKVKASYYLARLLYAYMTNSDINYFFDKLKSYNFSKGNINIQEYIKKIRSFVLNKTQYTKTMFKELFLKNVTFYWYIDPLELFTFQEILSF